MGDWLGVLPVNFEDVVRKLRKVIHGYFHVLENGYLWIFARYSNQLLIMKCESGIVIL